MTPRVPIALRPVVFERGGNNYGYWTLVERLDTALVPFVQPDKAAPVAFQCCAPMTFEPLPGKRNVLMSMYETPDLPQSAIDAVRQADLLIVPSRFCLDIFRPVVGPHVPIHVVPLGIDPPPQPARTLGVPFRWLYVAAQNPRKGWPVLCATWDRYFNRPAYHGKVELYMKTTFIDGVGMVERRGSFIFDSRSLERAELAALYGAAHAFVYPTLGEGFGLTLGEAMASGLPCVATAYGGHLQFATKRTCALVPAKLKRIQTAPGRESAAPDGKMTFATLNPENLVRAMLAVMQDYDAALAMGARAATAMRAYTWDAAAAKLAAILQREHAKAMRKAA